MQETKVPINKWAEDDRPREKLLRKGAGALSDSELLAILINKGTHKKNAIDLAKDVLKLGDNNLTELAKLSVKEMMKIRGIGEAKAITIAAALELGRRRHSSLTPGKSIVKSSKDIARYVQPLLRDLPCEVFAVIFLNQANRVNHFEVVSEGGLTGTVVDPRIILKRALEEDAVSLVLCHNHPSGNLRPSRADEELTRKIKEAARYLDISILDHIIIGESGYFSFADAGML